MSAEPTKQITVLDRVVNTLNATQMQASIKQALPPNVALDKFTRATLTAIQQNPDILDCDRNSLYNAIVRCAQDGLLPDGKQAAIVAFNTKVRMRNDSGAMVEVWIKKAQHMPMVEGIIHTMALAGVPAYAASVYTNDEFEQWNDETGQHIRHRPTKMGQERGARIGAFAVGRVTKTAQVYVEAMDMNDLEVPKRATKQKDSQGNLLGPWRDTPDRMEQKSALHRLAKRIPSLALRDDDEFNDAPTDAEVQAIATKQTAATATASNPAPAPTPTGKQRSAALQSVVDAVGSDAGASAGSDEQPEPEKTATKPDETKGKTKPETKETKPAAPQGKPQGTEVF